MQSEDQSSEFGAVESRVAKAAPGEPTDAQLARARAGVVPTRSRSRKRVTTRIASAVVALALVAVAVAVTSQDSSEPAFAYESAANALLPQDGVLHAALADDPNEPSSPPEEYWIDVANEQYRSEFMSPGSADITESYNVIAGGRLRTLTSFVNPITGEEQPHIVEGPAADQDDPSSMLSWIDRLADGIRTGDCDVSEESTTSGEPVWRVAWDYEGFDFWWHTEVVLRQSDYRPLTVEYELAVPSEDEPGGRRQMGSRVLFVTEWETLAREDVPADLFDIESLDAPGAAKTISYEVGDPRLATFSEFPVWYLGEDSSFGPLAGAMYETQHPGEDDIMAKNALTFTYGEGEIRGEGGVSIPTTGCSVTTYGMRDAAVVDEWWESNSAYDGRGTRSFVGDVEYRMYAARGWAMVLVVIDGSPIVINAPDETSALATIAELEPL